MDQGGVYEDGTPDQIFNHPQKELTRRFIYHLKVFETVIDSKKFDFIGTVSALDKYGYKNQIDAKTIYKIQSAFEELCGQILLNHIEEPKVSFTVEYDETNGKATLKVLYNGDDFDPLESEETLALKILENISNFVEHTVIENEDGYTNKVIVEIK